ncbi:MAG: ATP-binding protein [Bacteroidetes bacterium]|nr:ATP-binding protein [Bacteroidota bacterium]
MDKYIYICAVIRRDSILRLKKLSRQFRVLAVTGPRQSGKTTLVKEVFSKKPYFNIENIDDREYIKSDIKGFLRNLKQGAIIDEAQKLPELFSYLQEVVDNNNKAGQFILTGSNNFLLQENITQSLAGRVGYLHLLPLSLKELRENKLLKTDYKKHLYQGFYPEIIHRKINPSDWYENYTSTYLERDVRQLKSINNLGTFTKFLRLCASYVGAILNTNELANLCDIDQKTAASWLAVLQSSYIIFLLPPHFNNLNKRIIKSPKLYFYDTGLACYLMGIYNADKLLYDRMRGQLFENLLVVEKRKTAFNLNTREQLFYWRDKTGHEIDLLSENEKGLFAYEFKSGETVGKDDFKNLLFYNSLQEKKIKTKIIYGGKQSKNFSHKGDIESWLDFI